MKGNKINFYTIWVIVLLLFITYSGTNNGQAKQFQTSQIQTSAISDIIDIDGDDEFEVYADNNGLVGNGLAGSPYVISNLEINANGSTAISIQNTNLHFNIEDSEVYNGTYGILLHNVTNGNVINTVIRNNTISGVKIEDSNFTSFEGNNVYGNGEASCVGHLILSQIKLNIHAGGGYHYDPSHNSTVEGNYIHDNYVSGIIMLAATNITISGNNITNNGLCSNGGFNSLSLSQDGENDGQGIVAHDVENVKVNMNNIHDNTAYGVYLTNSSETTLVAKNNFEGNQQPQAYDDGPTNTFSCNWWGVVSTSHTIAGGSSVDTCATNVESEYNLAALDVPIPGVSNSETEPTSSDDEGDDGYLSHPLGLVSLILVTSIYRKFRKGSK